MHIKILKVRVLFVDDEVALVNAMTRSMAQFNFEIISATNGEDGIHLIRTKKPHVVVTDIVMPGKDGYEVAGYARSKGIPFILISGYKSIDVVQKGFKITGPEQFLAKPFSVHELTLRINAVLELHCLNRKVRARSP